MIGALAQVVECLPSIYQALSKSKIKWKLKTWPELLKSWLWIKAQNNSRLS
jgi:hypothetical protein